MAKDITIKNPQGTVIYYPKTVSDLVYNNTNGKTVKEELNEKIPIYKQTEVIEPLSATNTINGSFIKWDGGSYAGGVTTKWQINEYAVEGSERYLITGKNGTGVQGCLAAWYNGSTFISPALFPNSVSGNRGKTFTDIEVLAPSNATKLSVNNGGDDTATVAAKHIYMQSSTTSYIDTLDSIPTLTDDVEEAKDDITEIENSIYTEVESYNVFKGDFFEGSSYLGTNGDVQQVGTYIGRIARCEVKPNTFYYIYRSLTDDSVNMRCVDANGTKGKVIAPNGSELSNYRMPNYDASGTAYKGQIKTRSDTKYIDFNCYFSSSGVQPTDDNWEKVMVIEVGSEYDPNFVEPPYQEYFEPYTINRIESVEEDVEELKVKSRKTLKVLCVGNSFTQDSVGYSPFIIKGLVGDDIDLTIGIAFFGGAVLAQHCAAITNETQILVRPNQDPITYNPSSVIYTYYKYTNDADGWVSLGNSTIQSMIVDEDWDIITFQQGSNQADLEYEYYYKPFIHKIEKKVFELVSKPVRLEWFTIQGKGTTTTDRYNRWSGASQNSQTLINTTSFDLLSAFGTAVQNLRTISSIESLGVGGGLTYDGAHLQEGLGCLTAAYTHTITWLRVMGFDYVSIIGETTRPNVSWIEGHNIPGPNWGTQKEVIGITEDNCFLAQIAAINAVKKPYDITDLNEYVS